MSLGFSLPKTQLKSTFLCAAFMHAQSEREKEQAVLLSSDIYLSNPISLDPYLPSPPPAVL